MAIDYECHAEIYIYIGDTSFADVRRVYANKAKIKENTKKRDRHKSEERGWSTVNLNIG